MGQKGGRIAFTEKRASRLFGVMLGQVVTLSVYMHVEAGDEVIGVVVFVSDRETVVQGILMRITCCAIPTTTRAATAISGSRCGRRETLLASRLVGGKTETVCHTISADGPSIESGRDG